MYKIIINDSIIKEFKSIDKASEYYSENFKKADKIKMLKDNKILCKKL